MMQRSGDIPADEIEPAQPRPREASDARSEFHAPLVPDEHEERDLPGRDTESEKKRSGDGTQEPPKSLWRRAREHPWIVAGIVVALIAIAVATLLWWLNARQFETTDDAFIDARTVPISAQLNAAIVDVPVTDNQLCEAGTVLIRLDDRDFRAQVDQAQAQIDQAQANIANLDAQLDAQQARIEQAQKQVVQAQAALTFAQEEYDRYQKLAQSAAGTVQQAQQARSNLLQGQASLAAAQANAVATEKQLPVLQTQRRSAEAQLAQAEAAYRQAQANLSRTVITAPVEGRVTKLSAAKGAFAQVGQSLTMYVPREIWVTANFKETQLTLMQPGQPVDIMVDAFPQRTFHGHVDSIQSGSGAAFSLLPPENATGNYVKVVQRVPVKLVFDEPPDVLLGPGMSVTPKVKVR
jgi:membrane fusion protein (multidrug efflux system)